ncbi:hypothetical protein F6X39_10580 [Paraburkholderia sp. UCT2]|nr:hypothetical protein [Paraburkholderia sp. UCT2]
MSATGRADAGCRRCVAVCTRRVFIQKANSKLRPLVISTLRDRLCMTAAMLVLEPVFGRADGLSGPDGLMRCGRVMEGLFVI